MQVFSERMASRGGGPLPLAYYMRPEVTTADGAPPVDVFVAKLGGRTFHESLRSDSGFAVVTAFLLGGADVNVRDTHGATPLHTAVARVSPADGDGGDADTLLSSEGPNNLIVAFLLDNGADVNAHNNTGETPLMIAAATQNIAAVRILLIHGADPSLQDDLGNTVLHHAARHPHVLQTLQAWIDDLPARAAQENLLHVVCRQGGGAEFAALFLIEQLGLDVNAREDKTTTAPHAAIADDDVRHASGEVSNAPADAAAASPSSITVREGLTPLHCAVLAGDPVLVRVLLQKGADAERPDATGRTPLQLAKEGAALLSSSPFFIKRHCSSLRLHGRRGKTAKHSDPQRVCAVLEGYCNEVSSRKREVNLQREAAAEISMWRLISLVDVLSFGAAATVPHFVLALCALLPLPFWLLAAAAVLILMSCAGFSVHDERQLNARPLRSPGFFVSYTLALLTFSCLIEDAVAPQHPTGRQGLLLCGVGGAACALVAMWSNPGVVESTAGQRAGIYKTIFHSKGAPPEDVRQSIDLVCMVKKPLRAHRCRHLGRVVLRYDHYCLWLSSCIGGGNHRPYVGFLVFYTALLGIECHSAYLLLSGRIDTEVVLTHAPFRRFVDVYTSIVLPIVFLLSLWALLKQLWYISRGVTVYDVQHPSCSPWCFQLGSRTYSLFDAGPAKNMYRFFLRRENLLAVTHRMPVMSARLQHVAKTYQAHQFNSCQGGQCNQHTHRGGGHSHAGAACQQQQQQQQWNMPANTVPGNVDGGFGSLVTTSVVGSAPSTPAPALAAEAVADASTPRAIVVDAPTAAATTPLAFDAAVGRLFQLMVQQDGADVTAVAAAGELRLGVLPEEWPDVVNKAQSMFSFFKRTMNMGK
ncbi:putative huntingtin interacting protein (HIP) [Trypanosoma rangeli]|uniref:Palmitoyltransferase n=1 Tax=Trypanosoma rangeli TaxID=5698 RepID=A0A422N9R9_TRYRA|nr:putative huntingtin interacting protein (HIP) [Trypanosoma rangeli]RNF02191.1 putative huntingtin interacting protein (HIP) [Trypanosoma rangeli]|eukprot:RNF02191.1 putative huntingtin interacting protein (HIP) [Trypanosoma rangeli]